MFFLKKCLRNSSTYVIPVVDIIIINLLKLLSIKSKVLLLICNCLHRLGVRTPGFHPDNGGSIPPGDERKKPLLADIKKKTLLGLFLFYKGISQLRRYI